jgi:hypothetical protein
MAVQNGMTWHTSLGITAQTYPGILVYFNNESLSGLTEKLILLRKSTEYPASSITNHKGILTKSRNTEVDKQ